MVRKKTQGARSAIREMILSGHFKPGTFLPSVRELAKEVDMPKTTIHSILKMLNEEGLIQLQPNRRGALVVDNLNDNKLKKFLLRTSDFGYFGGTPEMSRFIAAICHAAERRFSDILMSFSDSQNIIEEISSLYRNKQIQGVVYISPKDRELEISKLEKMNIPYVVVNDVYGIEAVKCVQDFYDIGKRAFKYLYSNGHRYFSVLTGTQEDIIYRDSFEGFCSAATKKGIASENISCIEILTKKDHKKIEDHLKEVVVPNKKESHAFFTIRDYRAQMLYSTCEKLNLSIPDEISVISYDNINWAEGPYLGLTTFEEPVDDLATSALDMLSNWIKNKERPVNQLVKSSLLKRKSVKSI